MRLEREEKPTIRDIPNKDNLSPCAWPILLWHTCSMFTVYQMRQLNFSVSFSPFNIFPYLIPLGKMDKLQGEIEKQRQQSTEVTVESG